MHANTHTHTSTGLSFDLGRGCVLWCLACHPGEHALRERTAALGVGSASTAVAVSGWVPGASIAGRAAKERRERERENGTKSGGVGVQNSRIIPLPLSSREPPILACTHSEERERRERPPRAPNSLRPKLLRGLQGAPLGPPLHPSRSQCGILPTSAPKRAPIAPPRPQS